MKIFRPSTMVSCLFCYISYIYVHLTYIYMLSSIVKEATTFEMVLRGHKQATAHSHEPTKNSNPSKKNSQRQNSDSNLLINSKKTRNRSNKFRAAWYLTAGVVARQSATHGCSGCVGLGPHTEECWIGKGIDESRSCRSASWTRSLSLPPSPKNQHRRHSWIQRLHHPVFPRRCQDKTFRTSRWIHRWSGEHKNAESAKERGQARRQQVKSLEDQWRRRGQHQLQ